LAADVDAGKIASFLEHAGTAVKILLVEDDKQTADYITKGLREHGHVVDHADNGRDGLYLATGEKSYEVLIIDRMLPAMDGLSLVKAARATNVTTPVLFLTTMSGIDDRVTGLEAGGDDYLVKPFAFAELLARIRALARRPPIMAATALHAGDLEMDLLARTVTRAGRRDPDHAAGEGLGFPFRPEDQHRRDPHQPAALEDRQGLRQAPAPHRQGGRLCHSRA
jgi:CheY-like chemotaxis protein